MAADSCRSGARVRIVDSPADRAMALRIRTWVFVEEQGVPAELEVDGLDPLCTHFLAEIPGEGCTWTPVGAARMRRKGEAAKAERVAVLAPFRGQGLGALLMAAVEAEAASQGLEEVVLHAQMAVVPFYERLGYTAEGPVFDEAGIAHRRMRRALRAGSAVEL